MTIYNHIACENDYIFGRANFISKLYNDSIYTLKSNNRICIITISCKGNTPDILNDIFKGFDTVQYPVWQYETNDFINGFNVKAVSYEAVNTQHIKIAVLYNEETNLNEFINAIYEDSLYYSFTVHYLISRYELSDLFPQFHNKFRLSIGYIVPYSFCIGYVNTPENSRFIEELTNYFPSEIKYRHLEYLITINFRDMDFDIEYLMNLLTLYDGSFYIQVCSRNEVLLDYFKCFD